ncbi:MAG: metal-dependent hydrolase [Limnobacter sp.]|uniref:metal-dependent hydrolase n=1 Tax=Limnobacter sp. TaxID=2003368 RepID=UPI0022C9FF24|nr:metal-dependent hydrolase [Limnobacter sp.]MCZ8015222.1 metal-dependent hydrolase [Limnobacter sp.]
MQINQNITSDIKPREQLDFKLNNEIPKYWFRGDAYKTRIVDGFQLAFPEGERYFITSVRFFRDMVQDPQLQEDIRCFIRQEGQHGMMHTAFNKVLAEQGMPVEKILKREKGNLDRMTRQYSPRFNLALTAAFEHFTALMAETFFARKDVMAGAHPRVRALMGWHAIEEMEHRAVAFDVYQKAAKGGYWMRVMAMTLAVVKVFIALYKLTDEMLVADGFKLGKRLTMHLKNLPWLFGPRKGVFSSMLPNLLAYYKPGFHPNQQAVIHNYPAWIAAYEQSNDPLLAGEALYQAAF